MIRHFFLDKTNTINKGTVVNMGLNPVMMLTYGQGVSRGLLHFDLNELENLIGDKTISDTSKVSCKLKMTNCMSVDGFPYEKLIRHNLSNASKRAVSFDLILFKLPQCFDAGRGYDFVSDFWIKEGGSYSKEGSNWYQSANGNVWEVDKDKINLNNPGLNWDTVIRDFNLEGGIYSEEYIKNEIEKFNNEEDSIIVDVQHFDTGMENLEMDVTKYVLDSLSGKENNGLCLAFTPSFEEMKRDIQQYVGFFTDHTNTFFHPYIEMTYNEYICDNRERFVKGKDNKLYLYCNFGSEFSNLDNIPTCEIDGEMFEVKQATKGVYYAIIPQNSLDLDNNSIHYDVWSNLSVNGQEMEVVEMEFVALPEKSYFKMGDNAVFKNMVVPEIYGINENENVHRDEQREIIVDFRKKYTTDKKELIDGAEYRIYTKDGNREIEIIPYTLIERAFLNNFFIVYTQDLIPGRYFIDIKVKTGRDIITHKDILHFNIVSDVTERFE